MQENKPKEKDVTNKFKEWMGVGDLDISSSDNESDEEKIPSKSKLFN
jgi:hypothetical protein